ncbi:hypothetical protein G6F43_003477 [Rhizopus delemar]|nr:hypothetical protein G6F43_003477 [Rhizopus delemar]
MNNECTFCGSKEVKFEDGLAQCNACYHSWLYKKSTIIDFDDVFGDLDDLMPRKPQTINNNEKKSELETVEVSDQRDFSDMEENEQQDENKKESNLLKKPIVKQQQKINRKRKGTTQTTNEEEDEEPNYGLRKRRAIGKGVYLNEGNSYDDDEDEDEYIHDEEEADSDNNELGLMNYEEVSLNEEEENNDYEIYEPRAPSGSTLKNTTIKKRLKDQQKKKSSKPTNRYNPFILFNKEMRAKIKADNPGASNFEVSRMIGEAWKTLDPVKKEAYQELSKRKAQDYRNKANYFATRPKPPPNVWIIYSKQEIPKIRAENPTLSVNEASKIAAQHWKALSKEEQDKYRQTAQNARDEFRRTHPEETKAFYAQMTRTLQRTRNRNKMNKNE